MKRFRTKKEILENQENDLNANDIKEIVEKHKLFCSYTITREDSCNEKNREIETIYQAIVGTLRIKWSELNKFPIINLGNMSKYCSSVAQFSRLNSLFFF